MVRDVLGQGKNRGQGMMFIDLSNLKNCNECKWYKESVEVSNLYQNRLSKNLDPFSLGTDPRTRTPPRTTPGGD